MKVKPLGDKILVKRIEAEEKTKGGILLPDTAKEKPKEGKIIELGDGKLLDDGSRAAFQVKKGNRVIFTSYAGTEVKIDGEEYIIMSEDELVEVPDLPSLMRFSALRVPGLNRTLAEVEAEHIANVLASVDGNKTKAAEILGIDRKTLREKLKSKQGE